MVNDKKTSKTSSLDRQALLTALTTEHFTLQGARSSTVSESTSRASLYVSALSISLVAIGFISQADKAGNTFHIITIIVLSTLYVLGIFTFVRLVESSVEDLWYGRAINRIRNYYLEIAQDESYRFALGAHDDVPGVLANMGMTKLSRWQLYFTLAAMVEVLNAVVGGSAIGFVLNTIGLSLWQAIAVGIVGSILSLFLMTRLQRKMHYEASKRVKPLYPSVESLNK